MQQCIVCGNSYISERGRKYCSPKCLKKHWRQKNRTKDLNQRSAYNKRRWDKIKPILSEKNCEFCDNVFLPNRHTPTQPYCSRKCRMDAYRQNNKEKVNRWRRESYQRHKDTKRKWDIAYKDKNYFGGNRKVVVERDNNTCQKCGATEQIIVHHIDHSGTSSNPNNDLSNLITLCRACHGREHTY